MPPRDFDFKARAPLLPSLPLWCPTATTHILAPPARSLQGSKELGAFVRFLNEHATHPPRLPVPQAAEEEGDEEEGAGDHAGHAHAEGGSCSAAAAASPAAGASCSAGGHSEL